jgi:CHAD domain-containing protein
LAIVEKESLARKPGGRRPYELIRRELDERRIRALEKAQSHLKHISIDDLAARLGLAPEPRGHLAAGHGASVANLAAALEGAPHIIDDEAKIAARAFDRLRQRLAEFQAKALRTHAADKASQVHQLRIAAKRLRYLIETLSQMGYGDVARAVEWLKAIQDRLGELHDVEAFGEEIVRVAARPRFVRKHMAEAGEILQAASRFLARREGMRVRLLPVRVPPMLGAAMSRLTRSVSAGSASTTPVTARAPVSSPELTDSSQM